MRKLDDGWTKPIAYASKTFLPVEKNYSVIEKESLGTVFALTKYHRFIHGKGLCYKRITDHC